MKKYWELQHTVTYSDSYHDFVRVIGIFSTKKKALEIIKELVIKPGFCDYPDNFYVGEIHLNRDAWIDGFID